MLNIAIFKSAAEMFDSLENLSKKTVRLVFMRLFADLIAYSNNKSRIFILNTVAPTFMI